ncbi:XRE family transcriptional regulator [Metabacillus fastidiosus]|nr:XRE family transcriptional regulator [Metabacillus fastidiosus]
MKQKFIAEKDQISQGTLSLIVRGETLSTLPGAYRIAEVVGKPIEEIWVKIEYLRLINK